MIRAVIRFSAHNRFLVLLATAVFVGYGVYTLNHIPVDAIPDLSDTQVIVYSRWDRSPDIMGARRRVLESLSKIQPLLPAGVRTELGPDATGVDWVFQYALVDDSGT